MPLHVPLAWVAIGDKLKKKGFFNKKTARADVPRHSRDGSTRAKGMKKRSLPGEKGGIRGPGTPPSFGGTPY